MKLSSKPEVVVWPQSRRTSWSSPTFTLRKKAEAPGGEHRGVRYDAFDLRLRYRVSPCGLLATLWITNRLIRAVCNCVYGSGGASCLLAHVP